MHTNIEGKSMRQEPSPSESIKINEITYSSSFVVIWYKRIEDKNIRRFIREKDDKFKIKEEREKKEINQRTKKNPSFH